VAILEVVSRPCFLALVMMYTCDKSNEEREKRERERGEREREGGKERKKERWKGKKLISK
jgi:hypothetical protein